MRKNKISLYVFAILGMIVLTISDTLAVEPEANNETGEISILTPGGAGTCDNDFIVENLSDNGVKFKVVIGNEAYKDELIGAKEKRAYSLGGTILIVKSHGGNVNYGDMATIMNLDTQSKISLHCLNLKKNPLPKKDPLRGEKADQMEWLDIEGNTQGMMMVVGIVVIGLIIFFFTRKEIE